MRQIYPWCYREKEEERKSEGRGKEGGKRRKRRWKRKRRREDRGGRTERRIVLQVQVLSLTFFQFFEDFVINAFPKIY